MWRNLYSRPSMTCKIAFHSFLKRDEDSQRKSCKNHAKSYRSWRRSHDQLWSKTSAIAGLIASFKVWSKTISPRWDKGRARLASPSSNLLLSVEVMSLMVDALLNKIAKRMKQKQNPSLFIYISLLENIWGRVLHVCAKNIAILCICKIALLDTTDNKRSVFEIHVL